MSDEGLEPHRKLMGAGEGTMLGSLYIGDGQCGYPECESWRTVEFQIVAYDPDEGPTLRAYNLCMTHLPDFIDNQILRQPGWTMEGTAVEMEAEDDPL